MSKRLWISGVGLMLLTVAAANAADEAKVQVIEGDLTIVAEPGQKLERTMQVQVLGKEEPTWVIGDKPVPGQVFVTGSGIGQLDVIKLGDYWLGVECRRVSGPLSAQLDLPEDTGLVVQSVVPDSPAAKAGIRQYDLLMEVGDTPLKGVVDLIEAVEDAKVKEIEIKLIHRGELRVVKVTPAKRPEDARPQGVVRTPGGDLLKVDKWLGRDWSDRLGRGPTRFRFLHPGTILPSDAEARARLPGNMKLRIQKQGDEPARIVVERGDEKWEATEEELDKLPEDVRPHVQRMLGRAPSGLLDHVRQFDFEFVPDWTAPGPPGGRPPAPNGRLQQRLEKCMDEMNRRIEQMNKSMQELFKRHRPHEDPDQDTSAEVDSNET